ncbi:MAG: hypothetical protein EXS16_12360 [Gemmataceae bacterium]|nr:hypothetical protein [Gemmataceae bacterium]
MHARIAIIAILLFCCQYAHAVIVAKTPLKAIEGSATFVLVGKVDKHYPEKPAMMVVAIEDIKGKAPFRELPINLLVTDPESRKKNQIEPLLKRFGPDLEIVFFITQKEENLITFAFANGTWFQLHGTAIGKDKAVFQLLSAEPYFRKSFNGTTAELRKLLKDSAAGKIKLPSKVDDKVEPGFGPEYMRSKSSAMPIERFFGAATPTGGPLFAVIPTIGLGAPLAILAILFPSVFGGVFVLFRQWMAFITLLSINSTLLLLHVLGTGYLPRDSWWTTRSAAWIVMSIVSFACTYWAWRRQLNMLADGEPEAPARTELAVLGFMSGGCVLMTLGLAIFSQPIRWSDLGWTLTVVMTLAIVAGTLHRVWQATRRPGPFAAPPVSTEGVIAAAMLCGHLAFFPLFTSGSVDASGAVTGKQQTGAIQGKVSAVQQKWVYTAPENVFGMFANSPLIDGDAVYSSYSDATQRATMVRLDRHTGLQKWQFYGKKADLRQMISTACIADGKLYFGEGFHDDQNCRLFCVDAEKGKELWSFTTKGQTESSPTVANGKVYIGAGNDGVYCLDTQKSHEAGKGVVVWRFPPADYKGRLLRFGGGMVIVDDRLYCATGEDRNETKDKGETALFCFDANTGNELWRKTAPYPVWPAPVVRDGLVFVASGNGDVFSDVKEPEKTGGSVQCFNAKDGKELWAKSFPNGIIDSPAVDGHRIYFGCRDGHAYCINRATGETIWKYFLESPIVSTPVLDCDAGRERSLSVFYVTTGGRVACMNAHDGEMNWQFDLKEKRPLTSTSPRLVVTRIDDGYRRQLYFGCGIGGGAIEVYDNRPTFYCLEDKVLVK